MGQNADATKFIPACLMKNAFTMYLLISTKTIVHALKTDWNWNFVLSLFYNKGKAGEFIDSGNNTYGGKFVINPSGGLISKGHPLGATGMINLFSVFQKILIVLLCCL